MTRFFQLLSKFPKTVLLIILLLSVWFVFSIKKNLIDSEGKLILNTSLEPIISRKSGAFDFYHKIQGIFGKSDLIVVAFKKNKEGAFDYNFLKKYNKFSQKIKNEVPGVDQVLTLTNLPSIDHMLDIFGACQGKPNFYYSISSGFSGKCINIFGKDKVLPDKIAIYNNKIKSILTRMKKNPFALKNLISEDGNSIALIIYFKNSARPSSTKTQESLAGLIKHFHTKNIRIAFAGLSRVQYAAAKTIKSDFAFILPLSFLLMIIVLIFSFRRFSGVIVPLLIIFTGLLWTSGFFAILGYELNIMTVVLPPLLVSVGSAYIIHFLHQYYHEIQSKKENPIEETIGAITTPLVVTALTTIAGFAAITITPIPAIQEMGIFACMGIAIIIFLSLTMAPALLAFIPARPKEITTQKVSLLDGFLENMAIWTKKYSKIFIIFWIIIGVFSVIGFLKINVDSNPKSFPDDSPIAKDMKLIQDNLAGTTILKVIFSPRDGKSLLTKNTMTGLNTLESWMVGKTLDLKELKGIRIDKVYSPIDFLKIYLNFQHAKVTDIEDDEVIRLTKVMNKIKGVRFVSPDNKYLQILVRMKVDSSTDFLKIRHLIEEKSKLWLPHLKVEFTGIGVLTSESADSISKGQVKSIALALVVIFIILSILFLSPKMGLIALYPNVLSIAVFFGLLGWASIPLGVTVSVIASIALGIGVDSTIHFLSHFSDNLKDLRNEAMASSLSLKHVGKPMIYTTFTLSLGFGMFALSSMENQFLFGTLTAFTLFVCLITAINFLPSIMVRTRLITAWDYLALDYNKEFIQSIDIFRGMTIRETKIASLMAYTMDLKEGDVLFKQHEEGREMFVVLEGNIKVFLENGNENMTGTISSLGRGQTIGEMALFRKTHRTASAICVDHSRLLVINEDVLSRLKKRYPVIATKLFINLSKKLWLSITSSNPVIMDIMGRLGDETQTQESRLERIMDRVRERRIISYTGKANLEEVLKRVSKQQNEISQILKMANGGEIQINKSVRNLMLQGLSNREKKWVLDFFPIKKVKSGEKIISQGEKGDWLAIVLSGRFNVSFEDNKNSSIIATVHAGEMIGEAGLLSENHIHTATVKAVEDSILIIVSRKGMSILSHKKKYLSAKLTYNMVSLLSDRLEHMITTIHE